MLVELDRVGRESSAHYLVKWLGRPSTDVSWEDASCLDTAWSRKVIREYFTKLKEGSTKDEAFKETFGKLDLLKLDAAWKSYIRSL